MIDSNLIELTRESLWLVMLLAAPPVIVAAVVGLLIALVQAATQLQEQTFQYAMKFFAIGVTLLATASLVGATLYQFTDRIFANLASLGG